MEKWSKEMKKKWYEVQHDFIELYYYANLWNKNTFAETEIYRIFAIIHM